MDLCWIRCRFTVNLFAFVYKNIHYLILSEHHPFEKWSGPPLLLVLFGFTSGFRTIADHLAEFNRLVSDSYGFFSARVSCRLLVVTQFNCESSDGFKMISTYFVTEVKHIFLFNSFSGTSESEKSFSQRKTSLLEKPTRT